MNSIKSIFFRSLLFIAGTLGTSHLLSAQNGAVSEETYNVYVDEVDEDEYEEEYAGPFSKGFSINDSIKDRSYYQRSVTVADWQELAGSQEYVYQKEQVRVSKADDASWLAQLIASFFEFLFSPVGKTLLWTLLAVIIIWIGWRVTRNKGTYIFARGAGKIKLSPQKEQADDFVPISWESVIAQAEANEDYRLALRYAFRHVVHKMREKQVLELSDTRSNSQYLNALRSSVFFDDFRSLLRHYEYVWYGHYELSAASYKSVKQIYLDIRSKL